MIIRSIKIYGFGSIENREISFVDGVNTIKVKNEAEAETIREFVCAIFYGLNRKNGDGMRERYYPSAGQRFGGEILFDACGKRYIASYIWGKTIRDDKFLFNELPENKVVKLSPGKTIGMVAFGITEESFRASFCIDLSAKDTIGYLTATMSLSDNIEESFVNFNTVDKKTAEIDQIMINKMNAANNLARIREADRRILEKKQSLEETDKKRDENLKLAESQMKKYELAKSARIIFEKDKINAKLQSVLQLTREKAFLNEKKESSEKRSFAKEIWQEILAVIIGIVFLCLAPKFKFTAILGIAALGGGLVMAAYKYFDYSKRFSVAGDDGPMDVQIRIAEIDGRIAKENEELKELLAGRSLDDMKKEWRTAEETLKNAPDEFRRSALLVSNEESESRYKEICENLKPLDNEIEHKLDEIKVLAEPLKSLFAESYPLTVGIEGKIKELTDVSRRTELAKEAYQAALEETRSTLIPDLFDEAESIFKRAYVKDSIRYKTDDNLLITSNAYTADGKIRAKLSIYSAISKSLFTNEACVPMMAGVLDNETVKILTQKIPLEVSQLICFSKESDS